MHDSRASTRRKSGHLARVQVDGYVWKPSEVSPELKKSPRCKRCEESKIIEMPAVRHDVDWRKYTTSSGTLRGKVEFMTATLEGPASQEKGIAVASCQSKLHMEGTEHEMNRTGDHRGRRCLSDVLPIPTDFASTVGDFPRLKCHVETAQSEGTPGHKKTPAKRKKRVLLRIVRWFSCGKLPTEPEVKTFIKGAARGIAGSHSGRKSMRGSSNLYRARHQAFMQRVKDSMSGDEDFRTSIPSPTFFDYPALDLRQQAIFIVDEGPPERRSQRKDLDSAKIDDHGHMDAKRL